MDIGTAKPSQEERKRIKYHLIDLVYPDETFDAARYREESVKAIENIIKRGKSVIVVGGTGLYIKALTRGLFRGPRADFKLREELNREVRVLGSNHLYERLKKIDSFTAEKIHSHDTFRIIRALEVYYTTGKPLSKFHQEHSFGEIPYKTLKIGLKIERKNLYLRIDNRVDKMIKEGLIDEVKSLLKRDYTSDLKAMQTLGYKHITDYILTGGNLDESISLIKRDTKRYAKRQITWFNQDGEIRWFNPAEEEKIYQSIKEFFFSI
jgi:tRNA dimethylallyltransferase